MKNYNKSRTQTIMESPRPQLKGWLTTNTQPTRQTKELGGKIIPFMVDTEIDQKDVMATYKPTDFALENLINIGADAQLTEAMVQPSTLMLIDHMTDGAKQTMAKMDALKWYEENFNRNLKQKENQKEE